MATIVRYGDVEIHSALTREWQQTIEYDPSHTDVLYSRFALKFDGIVHIDGLATSKFNAPTWIKRDGTMPFSATSIYKDLVSYLSVPRLPLLVRLDPDDSGQSALSETLLECYPTTDTTFTNPHRDVDNGPKPRLLAINLIAGQNAFRVSWAVDVAKVTCLIASSQSSVPIVLSNRWSVDEDLGEDMRLTRTIAGRMRLSIPVASVTEKVLEQFKVIVVPGLERGFKRERIQFAVDPSGLDCSYTVIDRQIHTAPPWPAIKMEATHTEATSDGTGVNYVSEMSVRLVGRPDTDKRLLITRAVQVMDARLNFIAKMVKAANNATSGGDNANPSGYLLDAASIVDHIGEENVIETRVRLRWYGGMESYLANLTRGQLGTPLKLPDLPGQPEPYDPQLSPVPAYWGYVPQDGERRPTVLLMLQCFLQSPCVDKHNITGQESVASVGEPTSITEHEKLQSTADEKSPEGEIPKSPGTNASESAKIAMYSQGSLDNEYLVNECVLQLPIASMSNASTSSVTGGGADNTGSANSNSTSQDTSAFVTLARGQCRRIIRLDIERIGEWPEVIRPVKTYTDGTLKGRLLSHKIVPLPVTIAADQIQKVFRVQAKYVYGLNRPPTNTEKISTGVLPFTKFKLSDYPFDPNKAYKDSLGP